MAAQPASRKIGCTCGQAWTGQPAEGDPARRTERALAAAQTSLQAAAFGKVLELLVMAEAGPADELQAGRADLLRG